MIVLICLLQIIIVITRTRTFQKIRDKYLLVRVNFFHNDSDLLVMNPVCWCHITVTCNVNAGVNDMFIYQ